LLARDGEVLLRKAGPHNGIVQRVWREEKNDYPGELEWMPSGWAYSDEAISRRAVPVEPGIDSLPQETCHFWTLETVPAGKLAAVEIEIGGGPTSGTLQVSLSEGWK